MGRLLNAITGLSCAVLLAAPAIAADNGDITLVAVGDMFLGARIESHLRASGPDYPFIHTSDMLRGADVVIANLESPLTSATEPFMEKQYILKASKKAVESLKSASIDVVTLANNHMMDYGADGLRDTIKTLSDNGIAFTGAGENLAEARRPAVINVNGASVAVLSYSLTYPEEFYAGKRRPGTAPGVREMIETDIRRARKIADILVVAFHWGAERMTEPKPYQVELGRLCVDSGADVVIGHHPHVMQPVEIYKDKAIFYSLGNFVFGGYPTKATAGLAARLVFSFDNGKAALRSIEALPLNVTNREVEFRPVPLTGEAKLKAFEAIRLPGGKYTFDGEYRTVKREDSSPSADKGR